MSVCVGIVGPVVPGICGIVVIVIGTGLVMCIGVIGCCCVVNAAAGDEACG